MRPSSRARALRANTLYPVEIREIGKELQPAGLELCFVRPSTKKRHNWNDLKIVANCKDTPIRRCGRQSTRQLAERTPALCRNDRPDPSRRQIDKTKIRGHPSSMGNRFRWRAWIGREGPFPR